MPSPATTPSSFPPFILDRRCRRSPKLLPPLLAVLNHLFRCRLGLVLVWAFDRLLAGNTSIDLDIWLKFLRHRGILINRFPGTRGLTHPAINADFRID